MTAINEAALEAAIDCAADHDTGMRTLENAHIPSVREAAEAAVRKYVELTAATTTFQP